MSCLGVPSCVGLFQCWFLHLGWWGVTMKSLLFLSLLSMSLRRSRWPLCICWGLEMSQYLPHRWMFLGSWNESIWWITLYTARVLKWVKTTGVFKWVNLSCNAVCMVRVLKGVNFHCMLCMWQGSWNESRWLGSWNESIYTIMPHTFGVLKWVNFFCTFGVLKGVNYFKGLEMSQFLCPCTKFTHWSIETVQRMLLKASLAFAFTDLSFL